jgi:hypothetical protein
LFVGASTVKTNTQRLYEKLGVSDRAAAVAEGDAPRAAGVAPLYRVGQLFPRKVRANCGVMLGEAVNAVRCCVKTGAELLPSR